MLRRVGAILAVGVLGTSVAVGSRVWRDCEPRDAFVPGASAHLSLEDADFIDVMRQWCKNEHGVAGHGGWGTFVDRAVVDARQPLTAQELTLLTADFMHARGVYSLWKWGRQRKDNGFALRWHRLSGPASKSWMRQSMHVLYPFEQPPFASSDVSGIILVFDPRRELGIECCAPQHCRAESHAAPLHVIEGNHRVSACLAEGRDVRELFQLVDCYVGHEPGLEDEFLAYMKRHDLARFGAGASSEPRGEAERHTVIGWLGRRPAPSPPS